jgi:hypothetical protein
VIKLDFLALGIFLFFFGVIAIVLYVILAYALYTMAVKACIENPWMAWIPILQLYILGKLIKSLKIGTYQIPNIEIVLPVASVIAFLLGSVAVIGSLLSLANFVLFLFAVNKLYKMYKPEQATTYTILSIFAVTVPFIFLSIKDQTPVEVAD